MSATGPKLACYVINLPRSASRREKMEAQLDAMALPFTLFPAIDGRAEWDRLAPTLDEAAFRRNVGREVMPGEIGCYHAHLAVWRDFLAGTADVALVMEDDVVFHPEFRAALDAASGAVLEGLAAWDAEAEIEALGGESWRVAAARLGRMAGQGAALATLARDGREAARRFAEAHKIAWAEPAEAAGALGERLRAMSSCEGPPAAAVPPVANRSSTTSTRGWPSKPSA
jgi:hypothetical protein